MIVNNVKPISLTSARNFVENADISFSFEKVHFTESLGKVIAEDIISDINVPDFDKSPLDGYAFKKEDVIFATKDSPVTLDVIDVIMAGDVSDKVINSKQAVRIMTGAKVPNGADCIVRYEDTEFNEKYVKIFSHVKTDNIIKLGEDIQKGDILIKKDSVITPVEVGVLASLGISYISVYKTPNVAVFSTGSELLDVDEPMEDGKIRNSNSYTMEQLAKIYGATVTQGKKVSDDLESLVYTYKKLLENNDIVVSTGGISVGDSDFVMTALEKVGVKTIFSRVSAKPGGHVFFGTYNEKFVFALSGNPAAAFMNFYLYVRPLILRYQHKNSCNKKVSSKLINSFSKKAKVNRILRANTFYNEGQYFTELEDRQNSGVLSSMIGKNSIVILPENTEFKKDDIVEVEFIYGC